MANLIEIIISAQNNASNIINNVAGSLDGIGTSVTRAGVALTAATAAVTGFLGVSLKAASDQQTAMGQLEAVLRSTGGAAGILSQDALDLADSLMKVTRFGDDAILSAENMLLTFTSIGKDIFPDTTRAVLDLSTAMGQDLKSSAIQIGKALNDPITGITALRRVGVQFTDAQEEMIKGMVEAGDLMGAQRMILQELQKEFGGSAEAAGKTFAGQLDILKNKIGEVQETIGFALMPTLSELTERVGRVVDRVADWIAKNPDLTRKIVLFASALSVAGPALVIVGTGIKAVSSALSILPTAISLVTGALGLLLSPVGLIVAGVAGLATVLGVDLIGGFKAIADQVGVFIATIGESGLGGALRRLFVTFEDGSSTISTLLEGFGMSREQSQGIADRINEVFSGIGEAIRHFIAALPTELNVLVFTFQYHFGRIWDAVRPFLQPIIDWFTGASADGGLPGAIAGIPGWIKNYIIEPAIGIWRLIQPFIQPLVDWFNNDLPIAIGLVRTTLDDLGRGFMTFWDTTLKPVLQPIIDMINDMMNSAADTWEMLRRIGGGTPMRTLPGEISPGVIDTRGTNTLVGSGGEKPFSSLDKVVEFLFRADFERAGATFSRLLGKLGNDITNGMANLGSEGISRSANALIAQMEAQKAPLLTSADGLSTTVNTAFGGLVNTVNAQNTPLLSSIHDLGVNLGNAFANLLGQIGGGIRANLGGAFGLGTTDLGTGTSFDNAGTAFRGRGGGHVFDTGGINLNPGWFYSGVPEMHIPLANNQGMPEGVGGKHLTWNGDLIVQGGGSVNITRDQVEAWIEEFIFELEDD